MRGVTVKRHAGNPNPTPSRSTPYAAGYDLSYFGSDYVIEPGKWYLALTGFDIEIASGFCGFVQPRSGLALKYGIGVLNSPGLIDSDYRGSLGVVLINHSNEPFEIKSGDRIAQLVIMTYENQHNISLPEVDELSISTSLRGTNGFGSTGI